MLCDKKLICVTPGVGIEFNAEYRAMKEVGDSVYILNDLFQHKWYNKSRFVEKEALK